MISYRNQLYCLSDTSFKTEYYVYIYAFARLFYQTQCIQAIHFNGICAHWESNPQPFAHANAML